MTTLAPAIPCKDEYARLRPLAYLRAIRDYPYLTLLFVDDGSTDATAETLAYLARESPAIHALYLPRNVGKAEAVRTGVNWLLSHTQEDFVGFWDADLATPLDEIPRFLENLERHPGTRTVIGARWPHLGARVARSVFRQCTGNLMKTLIRQVLHLPVYDTQCGAKIFQRDLARKIFDRPFLSRWLFDVELLKRICALHQQQHVSELPLESWRDVPGSKVRFRDSVRLAFDLFRIAHLHEEDKPCYNNPPCTS